MEAAMTPEIDEFERHWEGCEQCSSQDPEQSICEEGFILLQAALKTEQSYDPDFANKR